MFVAYLPLVVTSLQIRQSDTSSVKIAEIRLEIQDFGGNRCFLKSAKRAAGAKKYGIWTVFKGKTVKFFIVTLLSTIYTTLPLPPVVVTAIVRDEHEG